MFRSGAFDDSSCAFHSSLRGLVLNIHVEPIRETVRRRTGLHLDGIVSSQRRRSVTYRSLCERTGNLGAYPAINELPSRARVAICLDNRVQMQYQLRDSGGDWVITDGDDLASARDIRAGSLDLERAASTSLGTGSAT
jgi:hypothetical protein